MKHIQTPVKAFTGTVVGVDFKNGVGHADDKAALAYFGRQGYDVTESCPEGCTSAPADESEKNLSPKELLQAEATELGLSTEGTKAELEARIADHKAANEEISSNDGDESEKK